MGRLGTEQASIPTHASVMRHRRGIGAPQKLGQADPGRIELVRPVALPLMRLSDQGSSRSRGHAIRALSPINPRWLRLGLGKLVTIGRQELPHALARLV